MLMTVDAMESGAGGSESAVALRTIIKTLTERGYDVGEPDWESRTLALPSIDSGSCEIQADDSGQITWSYVPSAGAHIEPGAISRIVLCLLGAQETALAEQHTKPHPDITLKGAVAHQMKARGLLVGVNMSVDEVTYNVDAAIEVTNPAKLKRGLVNVLDDGVIWWDCYSEDLAELAAEIAATIADMTART